MRTTLGTYARGPGHPDPSELGARPGETLRAYVRRLASCPACKAPEGEPCVTPSGRNHHERVEDAIFRELQLYDEKYQAMMPTPPHPLTNFEVDGGRYGGRDGRHGTCDLCGAQGVACISIPAAEDESSTGACEACVERMLGAFEADRLRRRARGSEW